MERSLSYCLMISPETPDLSCMYLIVEAVDADNGDYVLG